LRRDLKDSIVNQLSPSDADLGKHSQSNDVDRSVALNLEKQLELMRKVRRFSFKFFSARRLIRKRLILIQEKSFNLILKLLIALSKLALPRYQIF